MPNLDNFIVFKPSSAIIFASLNFNFYGRIISNQFSLRETIHKQSFAWTMWYFGDKTAAINSACFCFVFLGSLAGNCILDQLLGNFVYREEFSFSAELSDWCLALDGTRAGLVFGAQ